MWAKPSTNKTQAVAKEFANAVGSLFDLNNFEVQYNVHIHGSEIDIIAISKTDQFAQKIYLEVTIQYVDTIKYGKDLTKFAFVREQDPLSVCISVSKKGFTPEVKERSQNTRILTLTYEQLFHSFEKFGPYLDHILNDGSLAEFDRTYEEPLFSDGQGEHQATAWLDR
jgi:hypothetical protein